jgi:hypothetical protein
MFQSLFEEVQGMIPQLREVYMRVMGTHTEYTSSDVKHLDNKEQDINKIVVSSLLSVLEQSLQKPKVSPFLQAIEAVEDND